MLCMCVRERETERDRERQRDRETERGTRSELWAGERKNAGGSTMSLADTTRKQADSFRLETLELNMLFNILSLPS